MTEEPWKLNVAASAERALSRLPDKVAVAIVEFMLGPLSAEPLRVGHPLQRELAGLRIARRGAYRIVYVPNELKRVVEVVRIDHRADVYRPR